MSKGDNNVSSQLCWDCQKACGGCNWSREFKPVPGWNAIETKIESDEARSYLIKECPEFVADDENTSYHIKNNEGLILLMQKMIKITAEDLKEAQKELEIAKHNGDKRQINAAKAKVTEALTFFTDYLHLPAEAVLKIISKPKPKVEDPEMHITADMTSAEKAKEIERVRPCRKCKHHASGNYVSQHCAQCDFMHTHWDTKAQRHKRKYKYAY